MPANVPATVLSVASEKLSPNKLDTVAPTGLLASSSMAAKVALPSASGASFTALTFSVSVAGVVLEPSVIV